MKGWQKSLLLLIVTASAPVKAWPGGFSFQLLDAAGRAVPDAVVPLTPVGGSGPLRAEHSSVPAIMDQRDKSFDPHVLVVPTGTAVEFPNSDSVSHQVYSFSAAKSFQLPLYKGHRHPPIVFDQQGVVVLGCNIHDSMLGYIVVTDAPYFGKTDASGSVYLAAVKAGSYDLQVWGALIVDTPVSMARKVSITDSAAVQVVVRLRQKLRMAGSSSSPDQDRY